MEALRANRLTAKLKKCKWGAQILEYLGHTFGKGKVSVPEAKVEAIKNLKRPVTKKDLRSFLGTTSYYRRFVPQYADHSFSLTKATRKVAPLKIEWTDEILSDFLYLCTSLSHSCTLTILLPNDCFLLQTDVSKKGVSGILSVLRDEMELTVAFFSHQLVERERSYAATELECLAVKESVRHLEECIYMGDNSLYKKITKLYRVC